MFRAQLLLATSRPRQVLGRLGRDRDPGAVPPWRARLPMIVGLLTLFSIPLTVSVAFPEPWWVAQRMALRSEPAVAVPFSDEVVLVGLDERYAERYDYPERTSKAYLARVVGALARRRPTCIVLDFRFGASDVGTPEFEAFRAAARTAADSLGVPIVYPALLGRPGGAVDVVLEPPAALAGTGYSGTVSLIAPTAGTGLAAAAPPDLREAPLLTPVGGGRFAVSLPLVAVALQRDRSLLPSGPAIQSVLPDSAAADRLLSGLGLDPLARLRPLPVDFAAPPAARFGLAYLSSETLLDDRRPAAALADPIEGRIAIVAQTAASPDGSDVVGTPFGVLRGGLSHVYTVDTLLRGGRQASTSPLLAAVLALLVFCLVSGAWFARFSLALALSLAIGFVYVGAGYLAFAASGALVPMAWPLDAGLFAAMLGFLLHPEAPSAPSADGAPPGGPSRRHRKARRVLRGVFVAGEAGLGRRRVG